MPPTEFDRLRWQRDAAAERLIDAAVQAGETLWILVGPAASSPARARPCHGIHRRPAGGAACAATPPTARAAARRSATGSSGKPVLYVPLSRGGRPDRIVQARTRERLLERLAACLPRLGLVRDVGRSCSSPRPSRAGGPPGAASVSEFDRVFEAATTALVERIVESSGGDGAADAAIVTSRILEGLSLLVPKLLDTWMTHARQLRLSVLERVRDEGRSPWSASSSSATDRACSRSTCSLRRRSAAFSAAACATGSSSSSTQAAEPDERRPAGAAASRAAHRGPDSAGAADEAGGRPPAAGAGEHGREPRRVPRLELDHHAVRPG